MRGLVVITAGATLLFALARADAEPTPGAPPPHEIVSVHASHTTSKPSSRDTLRRLEALGYAEWTDVELTGQGDESGVVFHDPGRAFESLNLFKSRPAREAHLMDMDGRIVHTWRQPSEDEETWDFVELAPDGSLYGSAKFEALSKLDWESNVSWSLPIRPHHDLDVAEDGRVYVLTETRGEREREGTSYLIRDNEITIVSPEGEVERRVSLWALFRDQVPAKRLARIQGSRKKGFHGDVFHANSIEILDRDLDGVGKKGDVLLSIRELDTLAVVDLEAPRVVWSWGAGILDRQHHASVLEDGRMLVFDNGKQRGFSRVLELDPRERRLTWELRGDPPSSFFTGARGSTERLGNGNVLVVESAKGRVFEVTRDGEIVWDFFNPDVKKHKSRTRRAAVYRSPRLAPSLVEKLPLTPPPPPSE